MDRERWAVISPLLDRAFELPPGELTRWLQTVREDQPSLADELKGWLADRDAMRRAGFLEGRDGSV